MTFPFERRQIVRCINDAGARPLTVGATYMVMDILGNLEGVLTYVRIKCDDGQERNFFPNRFVAVLLPMGGDDEYDEIMTAQELFNNVCPGR